MEGIIAVRDSQADFDSDSWTKYCMNVAMGQGSAAMYVMGNGFFTSDLTSEQGSFLVLFSQAGIPKPNVKSWHPETPKFEEKGE